MLRKTHPPSVAAFVFLWREGLGIWRPVLIPGSANTDLGRPARAAASRQKLARFPALRDDARMGPSTSSCPRRKRCRSGIRNCEPLSGTSWTQLIRGKMSVCTPISARKRCSRLRGELEDHRLIVLQRDRSNAASDSPQKIAMLKMANRLIARYRAGTRLTPDHGAAHQALAARGGCWPAGHIRVILAQRSLALPRPQCRPTYPLNR
jgi:hypothetical protein